MPQADFSELRRLERDLEYASHKAIPAIDAILKHGAQNIKDDLADSARRSKHFSRIAPTISYDRASHIGQVAYEIGPDKDRGGAASLANIAYFGGVRGGGGTLDIDGPLEREEPKTLRELSREMGGLL